MLFNVLPWPTWRAEVAPDYTLFMPVTSRSTATVYQNTVPPRPGETDTPAVPPATTEATATTTTDNTTTTTTMNPAAVTSSETTGQESGQGESRHNPNTASTTNGGDSLYQFFNRIFEPSTTNYHSLDTHTTTSSSAATSLGPSTNQTMPIAASTTTSSSSSRGGASTSTRNGYTSLEMDSIHGGNHSEHGRQ